MNAAAILAAAERVRAAGPSSPRLARDPVSLPVIRAWTMPGLIPPASGDDDPLGVMTAELDAAGFTSVVATNCDQTYARYVRPGEQLAVRAELLDVTGPKRTALGEGWFVTTRSTWYSADEPVATMDFRVLKFRPPRPGLGHAASRETEPERGSPGGHSAPRGHPGAQWPGTRRDVMRPPLSPDTEFFWAGARQGELRIQRCGGCGALRHPPGPACPRCG